MASSRCRRKRCRFCKDLFRPDPRPKSRQVACSKPECQRARKRANQKSWLAKHPGYFARRSANTKAWRQENPEYQRRWRQEHPEARARDNAGRRRRRELADLARAEIQDSILLQGLVNKGLASYLAGLPDAEIQDSIWPQVILISVFSHLFLAHLGRRDTRLDRSHTSSADTLVATSEEAG